MVSSYIFYLSWRTWPKMLVRHPIDFSISFILILLILLFKRLLSSYSLKVRLFWAIMFFYDGGHFKWSKEHLPSCHDSRFCCSFKQLFGLAITFWSCSDLSLHGHSDRKTTLVRRVNSAPALWTFAVFAASQAIFWLISWDWCWSGCWSSLASPCSCLDSLYW